MATYPTSQLYPTDPWSLSYKPAPTPAITPTPTLSQGQVPGTTTQTSGFGNLLSQQPYTYPTNPRVYQPTPSASPGSTSGGSSGSTGSAPSNDAELQSLNTQFDYLKNQLEGQLGSLGTQKANALSSLDTQMQGIKGQVGKATTQAQESTRGETAKALSTAQDVKRSNRNVLRALGILSSSAAGEMLSRPMEEYDKQRAALSQALITRVNDLQDYLNQKVAEQSQYVKEIEGNYSTLVGNIQNDLRFNERQRADAIRQANAALQQRIAEAAQSVQNFQSQVEAQKAKAAQEWATYASYDNPTADRQAIAQQALNVIQQVTSSPQSVGLYQGRLYPYEQEKKNQLSNITYPVGY